MSEHSHYQDYRDLRGDGRIVLYKRQDHANPKWTARLKILGNTGYVVRSTKTGDEYEARRFSEDLYYELEGKARRGESLKSPLFRKVFSEWMSHLLTTPSKLSPQYIQGNIRLIENHSLDYLGSYQMDLITESVLLDYMTQRVTKPEKPPSKTSLQHERTVLNQIFRFGKQKGYVRDLPQIQIPSDGKPEPRTDISPDDYRTLFRFLRLYLEEAPDKRRRRERLYLQQYILILSNCGVRVGEARGIRWTDIGTANTLDGDERVSFYVRGKTGERTVVCNPGVDHYLKRLWEQRTLELGHPPDLKEPIFCNKDGKATHSYKKGFRRALTEAGVLYDEQGRTRVPYSLRHTYINFRLSQGVDIYHLASNCGTSVEMIESFYSNRRNTDPGNVSEITQTRHTPRSSTVDLPWMK